MKCEHCPVVKGLRCTRCRRLNVETDKSVTIFAPSGLMLEVEDNVVTSTSVIYNKPTVNRGDHSQRCGGGRRVIRKKISD